MSGKPKVMLDAGHGGHDPGAVGPGGLMEKAVALAVARRMGELLEQDFRVEHTRRDDRFIDLGQRAKLANDWGADAFVSIHCNSGPPGQGTGFEVFTTVGQTASDRLAKVVFEAYGAEFPANARRVDMRDGDVDKEAGFAVLRLAKCPAILFELEFIHTVPGERWLGDVRIQERCAQALATGVRKFFGVDDAAVKVSGIPAVRDELLVRLGELAELVKRL
jgi:N-acetylmuramoyl-L-alanine amidase